MLLPHVEVLQMLAQQVHIACFHHFVLFYAVHHDVRRKVWCVVCCMRAMFKYSNIDL